MVANDGQVGLAIKALAAQIRDDGLRPGDKLPSEMDLAKLLGSSRTVVREALRSLSALRIINQHAGRRSEVGAVDAHAITMLLAHGIDTDQIRIRDIYEVRRTIETRIVSLAAINRTHAEADKIVFHAERMLECFDNAEEVMEHDLAFHQLLGKASRNRVYSVLIDSLSGISREAWPIGWNVRRAQNSQIRIIEIHRKLARAVSDRDPELASQLMAEHFDDSYRMLDQAGIV